MPKLGAALAIAHYLGAISVGIIFRFYGRREEKKERSQRAHPQGNIFKRAFDAMVEAKTSDPRPFGKLFADSVTESITSLLKICCYIMFFSVIIEVLTVIGALGFIAVPLQALFSALGWDSNLVLPMLSGIFEIDVGTARIAVADAPLIQKAVMASAIIAWSGFSVHGQVSSVLAETDIRIAPYIVARILHAALAALFTLVLLSVVPFQQAIEAIPTFFNFAAGAEASQSWLFFGRSWLSQLSLAGINLGLMLALSLSTWFLRKLQLVWFKH